MPDDAGDDRMYNVTVTANDGPNSSTTQDMIITVTDVNDNTPVFTSNDKPSVAENTTAVVTLAATDADAGATLAFRISGGADMGLFALSGADLSFKAAPDFEKPADKGGDNVYNIIVQASDEGALTAEQSLTITVTDVNEVNNEVPVFTSVVITATKPENTPISETVLDVDAHNGDGGGTDASVTYTLSGDDEGIFTISPAGVITFVNAPDFENPADKGGDNVYNIIVQASDEGALTAEQSLTITVTDVNEVNNEVPVFTSVVITATKPENTPISETVLDVDAHNGDGGGTDASVTYTLSGDDEGIFTISPAGVITFVNAPDFEKPADKGGDNVYNIIVQASDEKFTAEQSLTITVTDVNEVNNEVPVFTSVVITATKPENTPISETVLDVDAHNGDGGGTDASVTYTLSGDDAGKFTISPAGVITFVNAPDFENPADKGGDNVYNIIVQASDEGALTAEQSLTITVTDVNEVNNEVPVFTSVVIMATKPENTPISETVLDVDAHNGDGGGTDASVTYTLSGDDEGIFTISPAGVITFVNAPDFENPADKGGDNVYNIIVQASDEKFTAEQSLTITVTDVNEVNNEVPVFTSVVITATKPENTPISETVLDVDAHNGDGGGTDASVTYTLSGDDAGKFTISPAGVITFVNAPDFENPADKGGDNVYNIIVQASDEGALTAEQSLTITVTDVNEVNNEVPVFTSVVITATKPENTSISETVLDVDAHNGDGGGTDASVTYTLSGDDAGKFTISPAGVITFVNAPDFEKPADKGGDNVYNIIVQASDEGALTAEQSLTITVTDVNEVNNEVPVFTSVVITATKPENTPISETVLDVDAHNGDGGGTDASVTYTLSGDDEGIFTISPAGVITFVNAPDFENPADKGGDNVYNITVQASDEKFTAEQSLTITVTDVNEVNNEVPVFTSVVITATKPENTPISETVLDVDAHNGDGGGTDASVTYTLSGDDAGKFTISPAGVITFVNAPDFENPADKGGDNVYNIIVQASDEKFTAEQSLTITVTDVNEVNNEVPVFISVVITATKPENTPISETVLDVDAHNGDGGGTDASVTYTLSGDDAGKFTISPAGVITFVNAPDFEKPADKGGDNVYNIIVQASDEKFTAEQSLTITVTDVNEVNNEVPVFTSVVTTATKPENTPVTETVLDVDAHNGDGGGTDASVTYTLSGTDAGKFTISAAGIITFANAPDFEKPADKDGDNVYNIIVQASDEGALTAEQSLTITVTNTNDNTPVFTSAVTASVSENTTAVVTLATTDADGQSKITYRLSGGVDKALFTILDDKLLFIKAPDFEKPADANGDNHFILTVAAGDGKHETEISIDVEVINDKGDDHLLSTSADLRLSVYPNPATDVLTVEGTLKEGELQLVNLMGVTVLRQQFTGRARLELAHLPEGLYLLRLHSGHKYSAYKVMKK